MCAPELSDIQTAIWQPFSTEDLIIVGIANQPVEAIEQFGIDNGLTYPLLQDTWSVYNQYYIPGGISPFPRDFIIDQQGIVQYANNEYDGDAMSLLVQELLNSVQNCVPGDITGDGLIDVLDIVAVVQIILSGLDPDSATLCAGDLDESGLIDILDIVQLVELILG